MEKRTIEFIQSLPISEAHRRTLMEMVEWEKELSWSDGYADAEEQADEASITRTCMFEADSE